MSRSFKKIKEKIKSIHEKDYYSGYDFEELCNIIDELMEEIDQLSEEIGFLDVNNPHC